MSRHATHATTLLCTVFAGLLTAMSACKKIDDTAVSTTAAAATHPDLSGVWKLAAPVEQLLTTQGRQPPLLAEALRQYQGRIAAKANGDLSWDPVQRCKPPGEPRTYLENSWPFEIVQTADRVDFLFQWNRMTRAVPVQPQQDAFIGPFYYGQSVGQWQGNAFVVDMVGVNDDVYLDPSGLPHSDSLHLTETFTLSADGKILQLKVKFEDPDTFASAWETQLEFVRQPLGSIVEDDCAVRLKQENRYPVLPASLYPH